MQKQQIKVLKYEKTPDEYGLSYTKKWVEAGEITGYLDIVYSSSNKAEWVNDRKVLDATHVFIARSFTGEITEKERVEYAGKQYIVLLASANAIKPGFLELYLKEVDSHAD